MKRWLAYETNYEPPFKSSRWGKSCIFFEFTDRNATRDDFEVHPSIAYHESAVIKAEHRQEPLPPLFTNDIGYGLVRRGMERIERCGH